MVFQKIVSLFSSLAGVLLSDLHCKSQYLMFPSKLLSKLLIIHFLANYAVRYRLLFLLLPIVLTSVPSVPKATEKLADLIFKSTYQQKINKPTIPIDLTIKPMVPPKIDYFPNLFPNKPPLEFNPAFNIHEIGSFFDFVGNLFSKRKKILQARELELGGLLPEAAEHYQSISEGDEQVAHEATLRLLAMPNINLNFNEIEFIEKLKATEHPYYATQGYLKEMISLIELKEYKAAIKLWNEWAQAYQKEYPSTSMDAMNIYALLLSNNFKELNKATSLYVSQHISLKHGSLINYYKAMSECVSGYYEICSNLLVKASNLSGHDFERKKYNYFAAWALFKSDKLEQFKKIISRTDKNVVDDQGEYDYLLFLVVFTQGNESEIVWQYRKLQTGSIWKQYAASNMLNRKDILKKHPDLVKEIEVMDFNFPEIKTYKFASLAKNAIKSEDYQKAEKLYQESITVNAEQSINHLLRFNLGQIYLKLGKNEEADGLFAELHESGFDKNLSGYYLLHSLFALDKGKEINEFDALNLHENKKKINRDKILAYGLVSAGKYNEAIKLLNKSYKTYKDQTLLEYYSEIAYNVEQFDSAINAYNIAQQKTVTLASNAASSFLAKKNPAKALKVITPFIDANRFDTKRVLIDVWNANSMFRETNLYSEKWFSEEQNPTHKFYFGIHKADSEYNMGRFKLAKSSYERLLKITTHESDKSNLYYYMMSSSLNSGDREQFYDDGRKILRLNLSDEIRYQIMQMVAGAYIEDNRPNDGMLLLSSYQDEFEYRAVDVQIQRVSMLKQFNEWKSCFTLGKTKLKGEKPQMKIDRIIEVSPCAKNLKQTDWIIKTIGASLNDPEKYRESERKIILAEALDSQGESEKVIGLLENIDSSEISQELSGNRSTLLSRNYLKTGEIKKASQELGNSEGKRGTENFGTALLIEAEIEIKKKSFKTASRILLRASFLSSIKQKTKTEAQIRLAEVYLMMNDSANTKKALDLLDEEKLPTEIKERYMKVESSLR